MTRTVGMTSEIERIQGTGETLRWSADLSAALVETAVAMHRYIVGDGQRQVLELGTDLVFECRDLFASLHGWEWTGRPFTLTRCGTCPLGFGDPDYFLAADGWPAAAVVHVEGPTDGLIWPAELTVDRLPCSWRRPDEATAFVLRPAGVPQ